MSEDFNAIEIAVLIVTLTSVVVIVVVIVAAVVSLFRPQRANSGSGE